MAYEKTSSETSYVIAVGNRASTIQEIISLAPLAVEVMGDLYFILIGSLVNTAIWMELLTNYMSF
jgi:hypothetical protein